MQSKVTSGKPKTENKKHKTRIYKNRKYRHTRRKINEAGNNSMRTLVPFHLELPALTLISMDRDHSMTLKSINVVLQMKRMKGKGFMIPTNKCRKICQNSIHGHLAWVVRR